MTLRTLPEIKAFDGLSSLAFEPDDAALARWNPGVQAAAASGDNVISIFGPIGEDPFSGDAFNTEGRISAALRRIGARDVVVNINSPGGDYFQGTGIYSVLRAHPHQVTVNILGLAASAASVIAMAGDDVRISPVGFYMVHNAWAVAIGNRHDFRKAAATLEPFDDAMANLYGVRSGAGKAEAAAWMDAETWLNAEQAIAAGLADESMAAAEIADKSSPETRALAAVRRLDAALARSGMPRSERRALMKEFRTGTPSAAEPATHDAGAFAAGLRGLIATLNT